MPAWLDASSRQHRWSVVWRPFTLVLLFAALLVRDARADQEPIVFNRDIRPILSDNCFFCHGPDEGQRKADLRLDLRDQALEVGAITPGDADASELVARILSDDPDVRMPPPESNKHLTSEQKQLLKRWVEEGAEYQGHWAYLPPVRPEIPEGKHPIDSLVQRRLEKLGLSPAPEADRRTLIRRLYLDLLGLPPTPQEVQAFVDDSSPRAYEELVERLLASPHYGERMAIGWLDVVRFADTIGYHSDNPRNVWPYRDYVIRAFNENKPFDQFTIEQLAGDLLPNSSLEQQVASCFNRLLLTTEEGGAQPKDYEARMLADRVRAVGTVWLGQTLGCCQCHDHKFDPSSARDFYSLGAFFADIQEPIIGAREPGILVPNQDQQAQLERLRQAVNQLEAELRADTPERVSAQASWEEQVLAALEQESQWVVLPVQEVSSEKGQSLSVEQNAVFANGNPPGGTDTYQVTVQTDLKGITGLRLEVLTHPGLPQQGPGRAGNGNFVLSELRVTDASQQPVALAHASATFEQEGFPAGAAIDGKVEPANGWAILGGTSHTQVICFELAEAIGSGEPQKLVFTLQQQHGGNHAIGRFRISATTASGPVRAPQVALPPQEILDVLRTDPNQRTEQQQAQAAEQFRKTSPLLADLRARLERARQELAAYEASLPRCLVSASMSNPRVVRILPRGNWMDESGPVVEPALPHYLPAADVPADRRLNRLDLAKWIVARENPLTARVFVNRLWKQFFGIGISRTVDDLGSQGEWPTHPELLDWLACEFMDSGWNVKHLVRTIVLSHTYRQVSTAPAELLAQDPENRLLARQSRFRLDAELIRDNALAVSGLLVRDIGGPSVKPYQPDGYWENLNFPPRQYEASTGEDQYRRGLYTWWQRSFLHPSLLAFDAPTREECAADRSRSNIPQQALVLLNDPTYVEAARALAARILREAGSDTESRLVWAWQQVLHRQPAPEELDAVRPLLAKHRTQYAENPEAASALAQVGGLAASPELDPAELAAWTNVARVLLNLHETITRN